MDNMNILGCLLAFGLFAVLFHKVWADDDDLNFRSDLFMDNEDYLEAKTRLTLAKAEREELKLAQEKHELLSREQVNLAWAEKVNIVKNKILSIPELAPVLINHTAGEIKSILNGKTREILNELANEDSGFESMESAS